MLINGIYTKEKINSPLQLKKTDWTIRGLRNTSSDNIQYYQNEKNIAEFNGISDFTGYALTNEDGSPAELSAPELD